jgi:hypothetical protein
MAEYPWRPLGELLVKRGLLDEYELEPLLLEQRLTGQLFGEMLVAKRIVSPIDMAVVIAEQHGLHLDPELRPMPEPSKAEADANGAGRSRWRPLGRILVDQELLTESGLQRVLLAQRRRGGLLGELLLERGYVTPEQLASALAEQHGVHVPAAALASAEEQPLEVEDVVYEVRAPRQDEDESPLHVSPSFLDASDFAFEFLYEVDPDGLEIVEVKGERRRIAWSYERPADDEREAG